MDKRSATTNREFRDFLKASRKSRHTTQGELATQLGLGKAHIGFIEQGFRNPSRKVSDDMAHLFGVDAAALWDLAFGSSPSTSSLLVPHRENPLDTPHAPSAIGEEEEHDTTDALSHPSTNDPSEDEGARLLMRMNWAIDCIERDQLWAGSHGQEVDIHALPRPLQMLVIRGYQAGSGRVLMTEEELTLAGKKFRMN